MHKLGVENFYVEKVGSSHRCGSEAASGVGSGKIILIRIRILEVQKVPDMTAARSAKTLKIA
jgi:hypothetical protein